MSTVIQSPDHRQMQETLSKWRQFISRPVHSKRSDLENEVAGQSQVTIDSADDADLEPTPQDPIDVAAEWEPIPDVPISADDLPASATLIPSEDVTEKATQGQQQSSDASADERPGG